MAGLYSSQEEIEAAAHFSGAVYVGGLIDFPTPPGYSLYLDSYDASIQGAGFYL